MILCFFPSLSASKHRQAEVGNAHAGKELSVCQYLACMKTAPSLSGFALLIFSI